MSARGIRKLLLVRKGRVFVESHGERVDPRLVDAVALELAALGYVPSQRLRERLLQLGDEGLTSFRAFVVDTLAEHTGAAQKHVPLFRSFPDGIPEDTWALWVRKVLVHYLQAPEQPCLFCGASGSTHVLSCGHVVCDRCFDGASYSACPVCQHHVDPSSPFFQPSASLSVPKERVVFRLVDLGVDADDEARAYFHQLCARKQALSPDDRVALKTVARWEWVPDAIPVRENVALVFGTLFEKHGAEEVLPSARRHLRTATDVLRLIAVMSGADPSLQGELHENRMIKRFRMAKLRRPLRRALLQLLEELNGDLLVEDMLRHQSYWVWVGEFLHPGEYAERFPSVARAFRVVRGDESFVTWSARLEACIAEKDGPGLLELLSSRPGELARRFDLALRIAGEPALLAFESHVRAFATPVLVNLASHLSQRDHKLNTRVYWPKGSHARGAFGPDRRAPLHGDSIVLAVDCVESELLRRFAEKKAYVDAVIDDGLRRIVVPFNERTASPSAVNLPRGSRIPVPAGKTVRLFLHWCQPEKGGRSTDLDLSVGFYDDAWIHLGVCSYYQLTLENQGHVVARSAGDLQDAPWPDGATELVDVDRERAVQAGFRYAVMVVNAYRGMPFDRLARAYAGVMLRDDPSGKHFDPRTVQLKFAVTGQHGIYLPLVLDLRENTLHWLDVSAKGQLAFNNVHSSNRAITTIGPKLIAYFESGHRPSMFDLALLHAAARCRRVILRGPTPKLFVRHDGESVRAYHLRLRAGKADELRMPALEHPTFAALEHGDLPLPEGSTAWALFREALTDTIAASDLLS